MMKISQNSRFIPFARGNIGSKEFRPESKAFVPSHKSDATSATTP